ncbi:VOC family protein [Candidatus Kaiserbacteria bacterium]|nr:VOC family protein [Candidatus Kaiserbacteria bacterium]
MLETIHDFKEDAKRYIDLFNAFTGKHNLTDKAQADHICYKCGSKESFEQLRVLFESNSSWIYQSIISNRRIAYIKLAEGIESALGTIHFLELSDQKPDGSQHDGFDHIEAYPTAYSYEEMVRELESSEKVLKIERPHHTTHDIDIGDKFLFRCTQGPLVEKIKSTEMI